MRSAEHPGGRQQTAPRGRRTQGSVGMLTWVIRGRHTVPPSRPNSQALHPVEFSRAASGVSDALLLIPTPLEGLLPREKHTSRAATERTRRWGCALCFPKSSGSHALAHTPTRAIAVAENQGQRIWNGSER